MTVILGPGACERCRARVVYARVVYALTPRRFLMAMSVARWRDADGRVHRCGRKIVA